jgi:hypothetical protein
LDATVPVPQQAAAATSAATAVHGVCAWLGEA